MAVFTLDATSCVVTQLVPGESRRIAAVDKSIPLLLHPLKSYGTHRHSQQAKAFVFHARTPLLHPQSGFPRQVHWLLTSSISANILNWTYHIFNKLKVIIMGDGNGVLGCGILGTLLQEPTENNNREQSCLDGRTSAI